MILSFPIKYISLLSVFLFSTCTVFQTKYDDIDSESTVKLNCIDRKNAISFVSIPTIRLSMVMSANNDIFINSQKKSSYMFMDVENYNNIYDKDEIKLIKSGDEYYLKNQHKESRESYLKALFISENPLNNITGVSNVEKIGNIRMKILATYTPGSQKRITYAIESANKVSSIIRANDTSRAWINLGIFRWEEPNIEQAHYAFEKAYLVDKNGFEPFIFYNISTYMRYLNKNISGKNVIRDMKTRPYDEMIRKVYDYDSILEQTERHSGDNRYKLMKSYFELNFLFNKGIYCMGNSIFSWPDEQCSGYDNYQIEPNETDYPACLCYKTKDKEIIDNTIKSLELIAPEKYIKESFIYNWIAISYHLKQDKIKAKEYFIKAFNADNGDERNLHPLFVYDYKSKNNNWLLHLIDKKINKNPSAYDYFLKSVLLLSTNNHSSSTDAALKAVEYNPNDFHANLALSSAYIKNSDLGNAEKTIQKCLQFHVNNMEIKKSLSLIAYNVVIDGKFPFSKIEEDYPKAFMNSGIIKLLKHNPKGAFEDFTWGLRYSVIAKSGQGSFVEILDRFYRNGSNNAFNILIDEKEKAKNRK